jgi:glycosyltransferase involved in cell wall biosynthesis
MNNTKAIDFVLLIPCYNNNKGLIHSLKSVCYPKEKCEILIVDDGSDPFISAQELMEKLPALTVKVIRIDKNKGIVNALNVGLNTIKSRIDIKYIARLDAGDICHPERFKKQVDFLNTHPEIALLSSWATFYNLTRKVGYSYTTQISHSAILKEMHYKCSFIHPAVMFRSEVLNTIGVYPTEFPHAEDYAFFWEIIQSYKGAIIPEKLVEIDFSEYSVSSKNYNKQLNSRKKVVKRFGDQLFHKLIGLLLLQIKQILPATLIQKIKQLKN